MFQTKPGTLMHQTKLGIKHIFEHIFSVIWVLKNKNTHELKRTHMCSLDPKNRLKFAFLTPRKKKYIFLQQKWIPHEKLDIKHVFYDYLLALNIIFKVVKRKGSTALSNYT